MGQRGQCEQRQERESEKGVSGRETKREYGERRSEFTLSSSYRGA